MESNPNFIHIGPTKTGTTWLQVQLSKHPDIWLPPVKEVNYFWGSGKHFKKKFFLARIKQKVIGTLDIKWRITYSKFRFKFYCSNVNQLSLRAAWWDFKYVFFPRNPSWYKALFPAGTTLITGDISPRYAGLGEKEIQKIAKELPQVKVIISLRNPIERYWSYVQMAVLKNSGKDIDEIPTNRFYEEFKKMYEQCRDYSSLVSKWSKYLSNENIKIVYFDLLEEDPNGFLDEILNFINADPQRFQNRNELAVKVNEGVGLSIPEELLDYLLDLHEAHIVNWANRTRHKYALNWMEKLKAYKKKSPQIF